MSASPSVTEALAATTANRRLVTSLSVLSGAVGLVPIPVVGDVAIDLIRMSLFRALAVRRGVALSPRLALVLAGADRAELTRTALAGLLTLAARFLRRHLARVLLWALRFEDMARTYVLGILFDYACVAHPPPVPLDEAWARRLRRALVTAEARTRSELLSQAFQRTLDEAVRAGTWLPRRLGSLLAALLHERAAQVTDELEEDAGGLFSRLLSHLEQEIRGTEQALLENLCIAFEEAWGGAPGRQDEGPP